MDFNVGDVVKGYFSDGDMVLRLTQPGNAEDNLVGIILETSTSQRVGTIWSHGFGFKDRTELISMGTGKQYPYIKTKFLEGFQP